MHHGCSLPIFALCLRLSWYINCILEYKSSEKRFLNFARLTTLCPEEDGSVRRGKGVCQFLMKYSGSL